MNTAQKIQKENKFDTVACFDNADWSAEKVIVTGTKYKFTFADGSRFNIDTKTKHMSTVY